MYGPSTVRAFGRTEYGRERIRRDLQQSDAGAEHEQCEQDDLEVVDEHRDRKQQTAEHHRPERERNRTGRIELTHDPCRGERDHAVGHKKGELRQEGFGVAEIEDRFHRRNQRIDRRGDESPCEEQRRDIGKRSTQLRRSIVHACLRGDARLGYRMLAYDEHRA
jgi:hypothetical protein